MAEDKKSKNDDWSWLALTAVVLVLALILPLTVGLLAWWCTRNRLNRGEYLAIGIVGVIGGFLITKGQALSAYFGWWFSGIGAALNKLLDSVAGSAVEPTHFSLIPSFYAIVGLALVAAVVCGTAGLFGETKMYNVLHRKKNVASTSARPSEEERRNLKVAQAPNRGLIIDPAAVASTPRPSSNGSPFRKSPTSAPEKVIPLGIDRSGRVQSLPYAKLGHGLIFGATGSGKTVTITTVAAGLLDLGIDVIMIDMKQDISDPDGLRNFLYNYAIQHLRPYQEIHLFTDNGPGAYWFNPLAGLNKDAARDAMLSLMSFDDAHWQAISRRVLAAAVAAFYEAHDCDPERFPEPSVYDIGRALSMGPAAFKDRIATVIQALPHRTKEDFRAITVDSDQNEKQQAAGLGAKLTNLYESDAGEIVLRPSGHNRALDVTAPGITYIGLDTLQIPDVSKMVSAAALIRLSALAGKRIADPSEPRRPLAIIVDEANWIDRTATSNLLSRARGAGINVILCTQGPTDYHDNPADRSDKKDYFTTFASNTNWSFVMAQADRESAKIMAEYLGTKQRDEITQTLRDGEVKEEGNVRTVEDFIVPIEELRALEQGEGFLKMRTPRIPPTWVAVNKRSPLEGPGH